MSMTIQPHTLFCLLAAVVEVSNGVSKLHKVLEIMDDHREENPPIDVG